MDFTLLVSEALDAGLIAPLVSLTVLPLVYRMVGISKREKRERTAQSLRMSMDLARGLNELAEMTDDESARRDYQAMRAHVMHDFLGKARSHFAEERKLERDPTASYWLLPKPQGFFGFIWSSAFIALSALLLMMIVGLLATYDASAQETGVLIAALLIVTFAFSAPIMLTRWFAFMSARHATAGHAAT